MRTWALAGALLLAVAGCATTSGAGRGADGPPPVVGRWQVEGSSAQFLITWDDGQLRMEGWDSSDGERFEILSVSWDEPRLRVSKRMPSTDHTTHSDLRLVDEDTLSGSMTGGWEGPDRWVRIRE
jgi:hypothetical protein